MEDVIKILKKANALITDDHFVGTSGRHLDTYINKDALFPHTAQVSKVGKLFANKYKNKKIDVVVAPALGGILLSQWTAYYLSKLKKKEVYGIYTEKDSENNQVFKRGYDAFVKGKNTLILEDLTTTGGSVKKAVNAVRKAGGKVVGVCVMVNRDPGLVNSKSIGAPFSALAVYRAKSYEENDCPLCAKGVPVNTKVGHGKKFLKSKGLLK